MSVPEYGDFVQLRGRTWLVEQVGSEQEGMPTLTLACVADDAQGEALEVVWDAEVAPTVHREGGWNALASQGADDPEVFAAYLRTVSWNTATSLTL